MYDYVAYIEYGFTALIPGLLKHEFHVSIINKSEGIIVLKKYASRSTFIVTQNTHRRLFISLLPGKSMPGGERCAYIIQIVSTSALSPETGGWEEAQVKDTARTGRRTPAALLLGV